MKTVMISGANGYFGVLACGFFQMRGWRVLRATRKAGDDFLFDLDRPEQFAALRVQQPVDLFIHAAAAHEVTCAREPYRATSQNVAGTLAALDFAVANRIPRFAYLSTFHVFGSPSGLLDERAVPTPANVYGLSHLQAEECVDLYRRRGLVAGFSVRPANFYGVPGSFTDFNRWTLTPLAFPKEALERGEIVLKSPGHQRRNFVHISAICDLIEGNALAGQPQPLLHAAGTETFSIRELALLVADVVHRELGRKIPVVFPEGENNEVAFEFSSLFAPPRPTPSMAEFIRDFARALLDRSQPDPKPS